MKIWKNKWVKRVLLCLLLLVVIRYSFLNHTEPTEIGIARNMITGEVWAQKTGGWHLNFPWVLVPIIDARPMRVSVQSAGHGYSAKLVQFDPDHWQEFVQVEGFRYYWWANRISFNFGYKEEYRGVKDILRGHAYGAKKYRFIKILEEYQ